MDIKRNKSFLILRMTICILLLVFVLTECTYEEPDFTVKGDKSITKDIKVNVTIIKEKNTIMTTAFYNGKSYDIDNHDALRYQIYVSYKNQFFYKIEADNLHEKVKGEPLNEIVIAKKGDSLTALYRPLKESDSLNGKTMQASSIFFSTANQEKAEKPKFTSLYKTK